MIAASLAAGAGPARIDYNRLAAEAKGPARLGEAVPALCGDSFAGR